MPVRLRRDFDDFRARTAARAARTRALTDCTEPLTACTELLSACTEPLTPRTKVLTGCTRALTGCRNAIPGALGWIYKRTEGAATRTERLSGCLIADCGLVKAASGTHALQKTIAEGGRRRLAQTPYRSHRSQFTDHCSPPPRFLAC